MQDIANLLMQSEFVLALPLEAADIASRARFSFSDQERLYLKSIWVAIVLLPLIEVMLEQPMRLHIANLVNDFPPSAISSMFVHAATPHVLITETIGFCLCLSHTLADLLPFEKILIEAFEKDLR